MAILFYLVFNLWNIYVGLYDGPLNHIFRRLILGYVYVWDFFFHLFTEFLHFFMIHSCYPEITIISLYIFFYNFLVTKVTVLFFCKWFE